MVVALTLLGKNTAAIPSSGTRRLFLKQTSRNAFNHSFTFPPPDPPAGYVCKVWSILKSLFESTVFEGIWEKVWRHFNANKVPFFASVFVKVDMCCFVEFKLNQNAISLDICCTNSIDFEIFEKKLAPKELSLPADLENRKKRILKNLEMCCFVKRGQLTHVTIRRKLK